MKTTFYVQARRQRLDGTILDHGEPVTGLGEEEAQAYARELRSRGFFTLTMPQRKRVMIHGVSYVPVYRRYAVIVSRAGLPDMPHGTETFIIDTAEDAADAIAQAQQRFTSDRQQVVDVREM